MHVPDRDRVVGQDAEEGEGRQELGVVDQHDVLGAALPHHQTGGRDHRGDAAEQTAGRARQVDAPQPCGPRGAEGPERSSIRHLVSELHQGGDLAVTDACILWWVRHRHHQDARHQLPPTIMRPIVSPALRAGSRTRSPQ